MVSPDRIDILTPPIGQIWNQWWGSEYNSNFSQDCTFKCTMSNICSVIRFQDLSCTYSTFNRNCRVRSVLYV